MQLELNFQGPKVVFPFLSSLPLDAKLSGKSLTIAFMSLTYQSTENELLI